MRIITKSYSSVTIMILGHVIELDPTNTQKTYFAKACGIARLAYNWSLVEWKRQYELDKTYRDECNNKGIDVDKSKLHRPTTFKIKKQFNSIKTKEFPFVSEVTKCSPQEAIIQLGKAFSNFLAGRSKFPNFRKKGHHDRFSLTNDQFKVDGKKISIPKLGWVRMKENLRFSGKIMSAKIFKRADRWFVSINVELDKVGKTHPKTQQNSYFSEMNYLFRDNCVGIDLGVETLATLSTGEKIKAPKPLKNQLAKLRRLSKQLSKKKIGGKNRQKAKTKLSKLHYQISCIRQDFLHKLTSRLVKQFDVICIENLNVKGMLKNKKLGRSIMDLGFYELKRQLIYKAKIHNKTIKQVGRFYPSSKTCSACGFVMGKLPLSVRNWQCPDCQTNHNRDLNAAINILRNADTILTI